VTGWGVVEERGAVVRHLASGTIAPSQARLCARLAHIHAECLALVARWAPAAVVVERAFVARNAQSALRLGEARGAVLAAVSAAGASLHEYAPAAVKLAAVGHGRADKRAMRRGVAVRLGVAEPSLSYDAADALAVALCHLGQAPLAARVADVLQREARGRGARPAAPARLGRLP
jgi:crossover junction endodeoxyribonuclease RuvC